MLTCCLLLVPVDSLGIRMGLVTSCHGCTHGFCLWDEERKGMSWWHFECSLCFCNFEMHVFCWNALNSSCLFAGNPFLVIAHICHRYFVLRLELNWPHFTFVLLTPMNTMHAA
ncbi:hypothetical protein COLO4_36627 [Corchorus olitorius]|uniref:Uncharacterized protein n=1 Tax=Corchorus olitorius TaxID=93759 RepID=A0A1R3G770_9ROSI|nr:hypothetical protein COLO4_36627 [Corchorus olitorius]